MTIKTWRERCDDFPDGHITTTLDIQRVMQDEIDELRQLLETIREALSLPSETMARGARITIEQAIGKQIECRDCEGADCYACGGTGKRRVGVFEPICHRHCTVCGGSDHHPDYYGDEDAEGEPLMACKHCTGLRPMNDKDFEE